MTILISLLISLGSAKTLKIAVLDTGFQYQNINNIPTCKKYNISINDTQGHGTNITGLIQTHAGEGDYCFYIYKVFGTKDNTSTNRAIIDAIKNGVRVINYSGGGYGEDIVESALIKSFLDMGGVFIAASGNDRRLLSVDHCKYYPACADSRITVVGNEANTSNYGSMVDIVLDGNLKTAYNITLSGSSQATAIYTGKFVNYYLKNAKVNKDTTDK
jgi:hypothetical protein